ncbi:MAG: hypothetical protein WCA89_17710 [Terracidiphilus sp.]
MKTGIVLAVPPEVVTVVCAAALIAKIAMQHAIPIICLCMVLLIPSLLEAKFNAMIVLTKVFTSPTGGRQGYEITA